MDERRTPAAASSSAFDMEFVVGVLLWAGVFLSVALIAAGLGWRWAQTGSPRLDYEISGANLFQFVVADIRQAMAGALRPRLLVNGGIALLMLTPFLRVLVSMLFFILAERNAKYAVFTAFVLGVLTYSLFLR